MESTPPIAQRRPETHTHHGDSRVDEYGWFADVENPELLAHLEAENAYAAALTAHLEPLRDELYAEVDSRTKQDDLSVPTRRGPWWYYSRTVTGMQYPIFARCPAVLDDWTPPTLVPDQPVDGEQVLLDCNVEALDAPFFAVGALTVSDNGELLGYSVDAAGDERFTIRVKDLVTGAMLADEVTGAFYGLEWDAAGGSFYYLVSDEAWRPFQVRRHVLGTDGADEVVFDEPDDRFWVGLDLTTSRRYLLISASSKTSSEVYLLDRLDPAAALQLVTPRTPLLEYDVDHAVIDGTDQLVIVHNGLVPETGETATDFVVSLAPVGESTPEQWRTVLGPLEGSRVLGAVALTSAIVVSVRAGAICRVRVLPLGEEFDGGVGPAWEVAFPEELYTAEFGHVADPEAPFVRLEYGSYVTPATSYDLDLAERSLLLRKQAEVLGVDLTRYTSRREWATASDGTRVPISLVQRADLTPGSGNPVVLYGYGSYESSMDPFFSVARLGLLDRGVVFAVAHVRGGGELGRHWYLQGRLRDKPNTFTDFLACADQLIGAGWADPNRIVAMGGSAGGLLMGAIANLAPQTFAGILAQVPFVDNLSTMLDPSLPLTVIEREEWGDPLNDPQAYEYIKAYAPYEQVADLPYPPILAITSLHDTRVRYVEPAKWIARLRERAPGGGPYLLKTEMDGGHGGASGRYRVWRDRAYEFAWLLDRLGLAG